MARYKYAVLAALHFLAKAQAQRSDGQYWPCNPIKNLTCPPNPGLQQSTYTVDFTDPPSDLSTYWSSSNYANITYNTQGVNGAEFTFRKRHDAPQLFTNFYIFFGRVDITMQVAPGKGMISSAVLISDDFDEIDWEMSGNNFGFTSPTVQNNYFAKGITGSYDRGQWVAAKSPQTTFHTYSFDWTPTRLQWLLDGQVVRTFLASDADSNTHQYPQTPAKIQIGIWDGGDPDENSGTVQWAGGYTNLTAAPYTMFVNSVTIKNYNPAKYYNWTDQSGSWKSIKPLNITLPSASTSSTASISTTTSILPLNTNLPVSPNGHCGSTTNTICKGSLFGDCCSFYGYCGNTTEYCGTGCQTNFGLCGNLLGQGVSVASTSISSTAIASGTRTISSTSPVASKSSSSSSIISKSSTTIKSTASSTSSTSSTTTARSSSAAVPITTKPASMTTSTKSSSTSTVTTQIKSSTQAASTQTAHYPWNWWGWGGSGGSWRNG